mmetsp:Transcript_35210/g.65226  ORF Transcript_35210/g.65226 Transcript_35210/m.65226 type:complete len:334 (+) Transcript_35210:290-1291(+)
MPRPRVSKLCGERSQQTNLYHRRVNPNPTIKRIPNEPSMQMGIRATFFVGTFITHLIRSVVADAISPLIFTFAIYVGFVFVIWLIARIPVHHLVAWSIELDYGNVRERFPQVLVLYRPRPSRFFLLWALPSPFTPLGLLGSKVSDYESARFVLLLLLSNVHPLLVGHTCLLAIECVFLVGWLDVVHEVLGHIPDAHHLARRGKPALVRHARLELVPRESSVLQYCEEGHLDAEDEIVPPVGLFGRTGAEPDQQLLPVSEEYNRFDGKELFRGAHRRYDVFCRHVEEKECIERDGVGDVVHHEIRHLPCLLVVLSSRQEYDGDRGKHQLDNDKL